MNLVAAGPRSIATRRRMFSGEGGLGKIIKFIVGGLLVFGLKSSLTVCFTEVFHLWYFASYAITLACISTFAFFYNARVTFRMAGGKRGALRRFIAALALSMALDAAIVGALTGLARTYYLLSIIISTVIVSAVKFGLYDLFVFRKVTEDSPGGNVYDKHHSANPLVRFMMERFHRALFECIALCTPREILDAGCGEGYTTGLVRARFPEASIVGLEPDPATLTVARRANPALDIRPGSIYAIFAAEKSFDLVMATEVLEHLDEPEKAIVECLRVSRRYCLFTVPSEPLWRVMNLARLAYVRRWGNTPGHVQHWNRRAFGKLLALHFAQVRLQTVFMWNVALCEKKDGTAP